MLELINEGVQVDAIITDPPYELGFMGKAWDSTGIAYDVQMWRLCLQLLKPGGHLLSFGGARTYHRMACAIEDAGFEIRDQIMYVYGSGFPKSLNISKQLDKMAGAEREIAGTRKKRGALGGVAYAQDKWTLEQSNKLLNLPITLPATDAAKQWDGFGTALKPAHEDIIVAQKPFDIYSLCSTLAHEIISSLCQLPSFAKIVKQNSRLSHFALKAEDSAQKNALLKNCTQEDLCALMATLQSESAKNTNLSIVLLWLDTLDAISKHSSMFTIETKTNLTTDLKILNSLLLANMQNNIIKELIEPNGIESNVEIVKSIFNGLSAKLEIIPELFVKESVISKVGAKGLRPDHRSVVLARKPLSEKNIASNVLTHGTGAINIDGCRVGSEPRTNLGMSSLGLMHDDEWKPKDVSSKVTGRFPANLIHDGSDEVEAEFAKAGIRKSTGGKGSATIESHARLYSGGYASRKNASLGGFGDSGTPARFFYCAKASTKERNGSKHPTVKPLTLMRYLCRLITPPNGVILDPFAGSGTTGQAAKAEGFDSILIEQDKQYIDDIKKRLK